MGEETYIGPFGRILPVPDKPDTPPPPRTDPRMLTSQVRLPLPTKLNFGSDPQPGFTDPRRYDSSRTRSAGSPASTSARHEKLPSVNQLLTPASPLSPPGTSRSSKREPLSPTEAAARHLYGWSKGYLEGLNPQQEYFPPQMTPGAPPSRYSSAAPPQYHSGDQYSALNRGPADIGSRSYPSSSSLPPFQGHANTPAYSQQPYHPQYLSGRGPSMGHSEYEVGGSSKPAPKFIGEQVFPGEGPCYVYDDGTHVRKTIDGESVNAQWGITKAGKPRKRLAIACLTCREKKIKCDPGEPKCVQCDKSGRECRFASA